MAESPLIACSCELCESFELLHTILGTCVLIRLACKTTCLLSCIFSFSKLSSLLLSFSSMPAVQEQPSPGEQETSRPPPPPGPAGPGREEWHGCRSLPEEGVDVAPTVTQRRGVKRMADRYITWQTPILPISSVCFDNNYTKQKHS